MTRVAILIPHFFAVGPRSADFNPVLNTYGSFRENARAFRAAALDRAIFQIHSLFGRQLHGLNHYDPAANGFPILAEKNIFAVDFEIFLFTVAQHHVLSDLRCRTPTFFKQIETVTSPLFLGMECWRWMKAHRGEYDLYVYMEDDTIIHDPLLFAKILSFNSEYGSEDPTFVLQPQRYEETLLSKTPGQIEAMRRVYTEYSYSETPLFDGRMISFPYFGRTVVLEPAHNALSGISVLTDTQVDLVTSHRAFSNIEEFAAKTTLGSPLTEVNILHRHALKVYKPTIGSSGYLEVQHGHQGVIRTFGD